MAEEEGRLLREENPLGNEKAGFRPQHKQAGTNLFEDTEGSNGALHTKDADVLAKIDALDTKVQGIIDGTTKAQTETQLIGSNVELPVEIKNSKIQIFVSTSFNVSAGATTDLMAATDFPNIKHVVAILLADSSHTNKVFYEVRVTGGTFVNSVDLLPSLDRSRGISDYVELKSFATKFRVKNEDLADHVYEIEIMGVV